MKNYKGTGADLDIIYSGTAYVSGQPIVIGDRIAICRGNVNAFENSTAALEGLFELAANSTETWTQGQPLYWDESEEELTNVALGNVPAGIAALSKANGEDEGTVRLQSNAGLAIGDISGVTAGTGLTGGGSSGSVTLNADVGTSANKLLQLNGSAQIPAVDGSLLTSVNAVKLRGVNVDTTAPTDGQVLTYNSAQTRWEPADASGGGGVPQTSWAAYTPTLEGFDVGSAADFQWRRDNDRVLIRGYLASNGMTGTYQSFSLPPGLTTIPSIVGIAEPCGQVLCSTGNFSRSVQTVFLAGQTKFHWSGINTSGDKDDWTGSDVDIPGNEFILTASILIDGWEV